MWQTNKKQNGQKGNPKVRIYLPDIPEEEKIKDWETYVLYVQELSKQHTDKDSLSVCPSNGVYTVTSKMSPMRNTLRWPSLVKIIGHKNQCSRSSLILTLLAVPGLQCVWLNGRPYDLSSSIRQKASQMFGRQVWEEGLTCWTLLMCSGSSPSFSQFKNGSSVAFFFF